jgi:hypothetical protein
MVRSPKTKYKLLKYKQKNFLKLGILFFLVVLISNLSILPGEAKEIEVRAQKASDFINSIGVEVRLYPDRELDLWEKTIKPRLQELGVRHIRTNLSAVGVSIEPGSLGRVIGDRINELAQLNPPIKTTGILREYGTWQSKINGIDYIANSLEAVEGPNEPNRKGEGFGYLDPAGERHGFETYSKDGNRKNREVSGEGWIHGIRFFSEDLYSALKHKFDIDILSFSPTYAADNKIKDYQNKHDWHLENWIDYGNFHVYRQTQPETGTEQRIERLRSTIYPTKPLIVTETGYSVNGHWPSVPNEEIQATYNLRSLLELFSLGVKRTFIFSLLRLEGPEPFSILEPNDASFPVYKPRTAFNALRDTIAILKDEDDDQFISQKLNYELVGKLKNVRHQFALQKSDGRFYLIFWLAIPHEKSELSRTLQFKVNNPNLNSARLYQPVENGTKVIRKIENIRKINFLTINSSPLIVELLHK